MHGTRSLFAILLGTSMIMTTRPVSGCTSFALRDTTMIAAKNYDWDLGAGLLVVNQRGVEKSFSVTPDSLAPTWTSRYGSVTFNQYGRDLPQGGINEAGLVVEALWLEGTVYPSDDARVDADCAQWVQYTLDIAASVDEAVGSLQQVQIVSRVPLHYFVADRLGHTASVEFLEGNQVVHRDETMPVAVLTNTPYEDALAYVVGRRDGTGEEDVRANGSRNRFLRAAAMLARTPARSGDPTACAFEVLAAVADPTFTQWSIVYDQTNRVIHFRTRETPARRTIRLDALDFSCTAPVAISDIEAAPVAGTVAWRPYTMAANLALIRRTYDATSFLAGIPESLRAIVAGYPDRSRCVR